MTKRLWSNPSLAVMLFFFASVVRAAPPDDRVRKELERVFARPEFNQRSQEWLLRILQWIAQLFQSVSGLSEAGGALFWLMLIGCFAVLLLLIGHITWTLYHAFHGSGGTSRQRRLAEERLRLSSHYREQAEQCAAAADFTAAVRFLFLSLAHALDERGALLFRRHLTNREYVAHFADRPVLLQQLRFFVDLLDTNWYGQRPTEHADYAHALTLYDKLLRQSWYGAERRAG